MSMSSWWDQIGQFVASKYHPLSSSQGTLQAPLPCPALSNDAAAEAKRSLATSRWVNAIKCVMEGNRESCAFPPLFTDVEDRRLMKWTRLLESVSSRLRQVVPTVEYFRRRSGTKVSDAHCISCYPAEYESFISQCTISRCIIIAERVTAYPIPQVHHQERPRPSEHHRLERQNGVGA